MGKKIALDLGDQWVGTAVSDATGTLARPLQTVATKELIPFLKKLFAKEPIDTVVVGYPKTMHGTVSAQTQKVIAAHAQLVQEFPAIVFILWDERLSSKRAELLSHELAKKKSKEERQHAHSVAAAYILDSYLMYQAHQREIA